MESIKDKVAIIGMGCSQFGEMWEKSGDDLVIDAAHEAYADAGLGQKDIQAAFIGTLYEGITGSCLTEPLKMDGIGVTRVENNCASGAEAIRLACYSIAAGAYDIVMAAGFEKTKDCGFTGLQFANKDGMHPVFGVGTTSAPACYALAATRYFHTYGITPDEGKTILAKIAVKNHHNGSLHPKAHFRKEIALETALNAPMIAWPLGLFDCCPTTDGAAVAILTRADMAENYTRDYILIKGMGLSLGWSNSWRGKTSALEGGVPTFWKETGTAAKQAYEQAEIKEPRKEIDIVECHDCFTITELVNYESLGLSPIGKGKEDVEAGTFALDGQLPVNADGGLKAFGHPIGASGIRMACEVYNQLLGKAGPRQIKDPKVGLTHSQGGNPANGFQASVQVYGLKD